MDRQEFIESFMDFINSFADSVFGDTPVETTASERKPITDYKAKCSLPRLSNVASHYRQDTAFIAGIARDLGIDLIANKGGLLISKDDCDLLCRVIRKKYNNFN